MTRKKGFDVRGLAACGYIISASGITQEAAQRELGKKRRKHQERCRKCQIILRPAQFAHLA